MTKDLIEQFMDRVWKKHDLTVIDELFIPDTIVHSPLGEYRGAQAMREAVQHWLIAFPDLIVTNGHVTAEEDRVVWQWTARGTHQGTFKGVAATGRPVNYSGATVYRVRDGKIVEYWAYVDTAHVLAQLKQEASV